MISNEFLFELKTTAMSPHVFTEDQLVEQAAVALFGELGGTTVSASDEVFGAPGTLQRETKRDFVLASRLRAALQRLNPPVRGFTTIQGFNAW